MNEKESALEELQADLFPHVPSNIVLVKVPQDFHVAKSSGPSQSSNDNHFTWSITLLLEHFLHLCSETQFSPGSASPHYLLLLVSLLLLPLNRESLNDGVAHRPVHGPFLFLLCALIQSHGLNPFLGRLLPDIHFHEFSNSMDFCPHLQIHISTQTGNISSQTEHANTFPEFLPPPHQPALPVTALSFLLLRLNI